MKWLLLIAYTTILPPDAPWVGMADGQFDTAIECAEAFTYVMDEYVGQIESHLIDGHVLQAACVRLPAEAVGNYF
jgi:hypothetical protein